MNTRIHCSRTHRSLHKKPFSLRQLIRCSPFLHITQHSIIRSVMKVRIKTRHLESSELTNLQKQRTYCCDIWCSRTSSHVQKIWMFDKTGFKNSVEGCSKTRATTNHSRGWIKQFLQKCRVLFFKITIFYFSIWSPLRPIHFVERCPSQLIASEYWGCHNAQNGPSHFYFLGNK